MDWDWIKQIVLSYWGRYGASWILKLLTVLLGYGAAEGQDTAVKIASGIGAGLAVLIDFIHDRITKHKQAVDATVKTLVIQDPAKGDYPASTTEQAKAIVKMDDPTKKAEAL